MLPFDLFPCHVYHDGHILDTIPPALLDRLEVIELPGYTLEEKTKIAERYLIPRQLSENGLTAGQLKITSKALVDIISRLHP